MSVINPRQYKKITDQLGSAYALVRDAIFDTVETAAYDHIQETQELIDATNDYNYNGSFPPTLPADTSPGSAGFETWIESDYYTAPPGKIARDLASTWYRLLNTDVSITGAKRTAANMFSGAVRTLNNHAINSMYGISTISSYYSTYSGEDEAAIRITNAAYGETGNAGVLKGRALFLDPDAPSTPDYFTTDFAELSAQLGITIDSDYIV